MMLGLGPLHFERYFCGVTSTTSSRNLHPLDLMLWYQKNDAIHLFYTCLSSPKIWKSENQVGLIQLLVNCVVKLSNKDFLSNWWLWMSQKRFLFWHAIQPMHAYHQTQTGEQMPQQFGSSEPTTERPDINPCVWSVFTTQPRMEFIVLGSDQGAMPKYTSNSICKLLFGRVELPITNHYPITSLDLVISVSF